MNAIIFVLFLQVVSLLQGFYPSPTLRRSNLPDFRVLSESSDLKLDDDVVSVIQNDSLAQYRDELSRLRGTPELVDRLINIAAEYPGIEVIFLL